MFDCVTPLKPEELVGGTELENCFEKSVHFLRSFSSHTYQEGSSEWRAQKRPSIYRSRAVIGREPMGVTAKLYEVSYIQKKLKHQKVLSAAAVFDCVTPLKPEELVGGTELENCFEKSVHFLRSFSSHTYQEGSSEWRAQKRPSIYRSRAVIGREPMGVTAKLYEVSSQLSGNMQNF